MSKKWYALLSVVVLFSMLLTACGPTDTPTQAPAMTDAPAATEAPTTNGEPTEGVTTPSGKTVLRVWSFTNEINTMAIAFEARYPDVDVQYTMIPMTNGEYQTKLLAALRTADAPDVIALEASFVRSYVESDFLADLGALLPAAEAAQTYPFVIEVGTYDGIVKAFSYQATPGALFYRRSLAQEYFGTDDPVQMQALLADMDMYTAAAEIVKEQSGGNTFMVASSGDFMNLFYANREQPWIVDETLVIDPMVDQMIDTAKIFRDNGYEAQASQWGEGWFAGMNDSLVAADGTPKQIFSYFLPTWGLPYVLAPNAKSADGSSDTSGDWAVITGPLPYQWGGTWIGVIKDSPQMDLAMEFVRFATLDEENLTNWATGVYTNEFLKAVDPAVAPDQQQAPGDFVSSQVVVDKIITSFDDSELSSFLGGQNSYAGFAAAAPSVNAKLMTGADDAIQRALNDPLNQYLAGTMTRDQMWSTWKDAVRNEFPDLIIE